MKSSKLNSRTNTSDQIHLKREPFFSPSGKGDFFSNSSDVSQSFFSPTTVQPKLSVGQPNDKYEVEADAMADKVVGSLNGNAESHETAGTSIPTVQAKCNTCEQEEQLQKKEEEFSETGENIQAKADGSSTNNSTNIESKLSSSKGQGKPLSPEIQNSMGASFGKDFSDVKVHTDSNAVQMNKELNAHAFTHGNDIYFNQGKYDTSSSNGKHLLAHELTHTVQQSGGIQTALIQRTPSAEFEERYPAFMDSLLNVSSNIDTYLEELNYPESSVRSRRDIIQHGGVQFNLANINRTFAQIQGRYMLVDEAVFNERMVGNVNEELTHRWLGTTRRFIHYLRALAYAQYVYPQYGGSTSFRRDIPFELRSIITQLAELGRHQFIQTYGSELVEEANAERARQEAIEPETRTVSIEETISQTRAYIRENLNGIMREEHPHRWYARGMTNLLRHNLGTDSERYLEFFRTLRSQSRELLFLLAFDGQLSTNLFSMGIRGLEEIAELRGSNTQFAYHMVLGSWNFDEATGEEHEAPGIALVFDILVGLVPVLGQVVDVRDIAGFIYRLSKFENQRSSWGTWIGLIGSLIGLVPAAGDAGKSLLSSLRHGLSDMPVGRMSESVVQGITRFIDRRYLEMLLDSSDNLARTLTVRWTVIQGRILNQWDEIIRAYEPYMVQLTDLTAAQIAGLRAAAQEILPQRLQETGTLLREVIESISRNTVDEVRAIMREVRELSADGRLANALEDFERMEREALEAAERGAAHEANEIIDDMRRRLGGDTEDVAEDAASRTDLGDSLEEGAPSILTTPRGTAHPRSTEQTRLLNESASVPDGADLSTLHREAELDIVRRSEIQASDRAGYTGQVDIGNTHTWRQRPDGTWCRFSDDPSLCNTVIRYGEEAARALADERTFSQLVERLVREAQSGGGSRHVNLENLSPEELEALEQVFDDLDDLSHLTLRDLREARGRLGSESERLLELRDAEIERIRILNQPLYDRLRQASPGPVRESILRRARRRDPTSGDLIFVDEITGVPSTSSLSPRQIAAGRTSTLDVDHIIPLEEIIEIPGFKELSPAAQLSIVNNPEILMTMDFAANSSKGSRGWALWPQASFYYTQQQIADMVVKEQRVRQLIRDLITAASS